MNHNCIQSKVRLTLKRKIDCLPTMDSTIKFETELTKTIVSSHFESKITKRLQYKIITFQVL
jgi:hypothetical protein